MENRLYSREPVKFMARLVQQGRVVATAEVIDMSLYGLGIKCPDVALKNGQILEVDLTKPGHPRGVSCCVPTMVVHTGPESVGLMLAYDMDMQMVLSA